jgi:hypothetical protein
MLPVKNDGEGLLKNRPFFFLGQIAIQINAGQYLLPLNPSKHDEHILCLLCCS